MIPYLKGGEKPSQIYMNALFDAFDAKLSLMLAGGKTFFLAQDAAMPQKLCGKAFFFTTGTATLANRVPGWIDAGGNVTRPYNHDQFLTAVAAIDLSTVIWDEVNKVAFVPAFDASAYAGLVTNINSTTHLPVGTGLLDWSMQAHYLMHQGASDSAPVPYYIQEQSESLPDFPSSIAPEKRYKFCVAEIIIEGPNYVVLPVTYDKYNCFRVHNLNPFVTKLHFENHDDYELQPFECRTIRRDGPDGPIGVGPSGNYRDGGHYFFKFEAGDPRFYWFIPKGFTTIGMSPFPDDNGTAVTNSMAANNLTNPAILHDWVKFFERDLGKGATSYSSALTDAQQYCGWQQDNTVLADQYSFYAKKLGDPSKGATLLGDCIHHQGDILIFRASKTLLDPITSEPVVVVDKVTFRGYATIVSDFAAHQLSVTTNGDGDLVIASTDSANDVTLVPFGTNLFKQGDTHPTAVSLVGSDTFTIENAIFEAPDPASLSATAPQLIFQPTPTTATANRQWYNWNAGSGDYTNSATVSGTAQTTLNWNNPRSMSLTLHGIHSITVADFLALDFWGDPAVPGQGGTYVTVSNRRLHLTPDGLVVTYTIAEAANYAPGDTDWRRLLRGRTVTESIPMRGHGFGYVSDANGSRDTGWLSCRANRWLFPDAYVDEVVGVAGKDFDVQGDASETTVNILGRLVPSDLDQGWDKRFWGTTPNDWLLKLVENSTQDAHVLSGLWAASDATTINNGTAAIVQGAVDPISMVLLPEMYNLMVQSLNSLTVCSPLSWRALRWNLSGFPVGLWAKSDGPSGQGFLIPNQYADAAGVFEEGNWDPNTNTPFLKSGVGKSGHFYVVLTTGGGDTALDGVGGWVDGDIAYFDITGVWKKLPGGITPAGSDFWREYDGAVPMSLFAAFDIGSQYHALCNHLGIPVYSDVDLPGASNGVPFSTLKNEPVGRGLIVNQIWGVASGVSGNGTTLSCTLETNIFSELLDTTKLLSGTPTGARCNGSWDDSLLVSGSNVSCSYNDIGKYWIVPNDMTTAGGNPSALGDIYKGDIVMINGCTTDMTLGVLGVLAVSHTADVIVAQKGVTLSGFDLNVFTTGGQSDISAGGGIRWIKIADVKAFIEGLGFQFIHIEEMVPMSLIVTDPFPFPMGPFMDSGTSNRSLSVSGASPSTATDIAPALANQFVTDPRLGHFIRFSSVEDGNALWKSLATNDDGIPGFLAICHIDACPGNSGFLNALEGGVRFDPTTPGLGATFNTNYSAPYQTYGKGTDDTVSPVQYFYAGYIASGAGPNGGNPYLSQVQNPLSISTGNGEIPPVYAEGILGNQMMIRAFNVSGSSAYQVNPVKVVLTGMEAWTYEDSFWTTSLQTLNQYIDSGGEFGGLGATSGGFKPWIHLGAPSDFTINIGDGVTLIIPPTTQALYAMRTNIGAPQVAFT